MLIEKNEAKDTPMLSQQCHKGLRIVNWLAFILLFTIGCDPVSTTRQYIGVQISDAVSNEDIKGVEVRLKAPYGYIQSPGREIKSTDDTWINEDPFFEGTTDANGLAEIGVEVTAINHTAWLFKGLTEPPDLVSGREYICRLSNDEVVDLLRITLEPGKTQHGKYFDVFVTKVGNPEFTKR